MPKTWLITGSSRGLGRAISEAVLASGDNLAATARHQDNYRCAGKEPAGDAERLVRATCSSHQVANIATAYWVIRGLTHGVTWAGRVSPSGIVANRWRSKAGPRRRREMTGRERLHDSPPDGTMTARSPPGGSLS